MRFWRSAEGKILRELMKFDPIPAEYLAHVQAVNYRQRVQPVNAGHYTFSLYVREAARGNRELVIATSRRNTQAGVFDFSHREPETLTCIS